MKREFAAMLLVLAAASAATAQNKENVFTVKGILADSLTNHVLSYSSVRITL